MATWDRALEAYRKGVQYSSGLRMAHRPGYIYVGLSTPIRQF